MLFSTFKLDLWTHHVHRAGNLNGKTYSRTEGLFSVPKAQNYGASLIDAPVSTSKGRATRRGRALTRYTSTDDGRGRGLLQTGNRPRSSGANHGAVSVLAAAEAGYGARQIGQYEYDDDQLSSVELEYRSLEQEGVWMMSIHTHLVAEDAFMRPSAQSLLDYRVTVRSVGDDATPTKVPESISVAGEDHDVEFRRYESRDIAVLEVPGKKVIVVVERSRDAVDRHVGLTVIAPGQPLTLAG